MIPPGHRDDAAGASPSSPAMLAAVEAELRSVLRGVLPEPYAEMDSMVGHHLGWEPGAAPGKRIRPMLTLLCAASAGGDWRRAVPAAASVELIHNFSLVHDDIEDSSQTRRGRPTVWSRWGIPQAINTGDFLYVTSHLACHRLIAAGTSVETAHAAQHELDDASLQLTLGQHLDMAFEQRPIVPAEEYLRMIAGKTASLLAAAAAVGAMVAQASSTACDAYRRFGWRLGMAFQLLDDLLGIWGEPDQTGKSVADDLRQGKKTYPVLLGLERSPEFADLWASARETTPDVEGLRKALKACGAESDTRREAETHTGQAMEALEAARPRPPAASELKALAEGLLRRDR
jgi:geranylgeranyl diphosphate synthase type I